MATTAEATFVKPRKRRRSGLSERRLAAAMVSPSLIVILIVAAYPIIYAIWLSLHQYSVIHPGLSRWVGLDNYKDAVTSSSFWSAVKTTLRPSFSTQVTDRALVRWMKEVITLQTAAMVPAENTPLITRSAISVARSDLAPSGVGRVARWTLTK